MSFGRPTPSAVTDVLAAIQRNVERLRGYLVTFRGSYRVLILFGGSETTVVKGDQGVTVTSSLRMSDGVPLAPPTSHTRLQGRFTLTRRSRLHARQCSLDDRDSEGGVGPAVRLAFSLPPRVLSRLLPL